MIQTKDITGARLRHSTMAMARISRKHRNVKFVKFPASTKRAFSLVEVMICLIIVLAAAIGTISAITYTRLNLELEKQRLAALGYCRQAMEAVQSLDTASAGTKMLVPFNSPGIEDLNAQLKVEYFALNNDGTVKWSSPLGGPAVNRPVYARVSVQWVPYGSIARNQEVAMSTIVTRGID